MLEEGAIHPSAATDEDSIEHSRGVVLLDREVTIVEVENCLQISHGPAYEIIHNGLVFHDVRARCLPDQLTVLHEQTHLGTW
jgi:hypothetical protein